MNLRIDPATTTPYRPWTDGEVTAIFAFKAAGLTRKQIAQKLGRSFASVVHKLQDPRPARGRSFDHYSNLTPLAGENLQKEYRACTIAHLNDIMREHGFNASWASLNIGPEPGARFYYVGYSGSCCGSSASMCADLGGSFR